jgi:hypothetical protein
MAKITTKKPTVLIQTKKPLEKGPDTAPIDAPRSSGPRTSPSADLLIPEARPAGRANPTHVTAPPVKSPPPYDPPKKKGSPALLVLLALLLVGGAAFKFLGKGPAAQLSGTSGGDLSRSMLLEDDRLKLSHSIWKNEEPGLISRIFHRLCLGYATSDGCGEKPLHPFRQVYDEVGKPLKFASEPDRLVIEQTIEYDSRGFAMKK